MQCTVHTGNSLGIGIIEKYVGRYWMFNMPYAMSQMEELSCACAIVQPPSTTTGTVLVQ
jgi:hypothetical protein